MATAVWKGSLTFGLLSIPIRLYTAARSERTVLHQLHDKCHTRLRQPLFCPTCNRIVKRSEVVKGYEYEKGHYVIVTQEDLKKITPETGGGMELLAFVKKDQIDPIYMDTSYLAMPDKGADKAYQLLTKALEDTDEVGIAQFTMHQRSYTVFVRARNHGLTLHTMYYANEIRHVAGYGQVPRNLQLKAQEIALAEQLIASLTEDFKPEQYKDTFQEQLRGLVDAKRKGKAFLEKAAPQPAKVIDMMEALKQSLRSRQSAAPGPKRRRTAPHQRRAAS